MIPNEQLHEHQPRSIFSTWIGFVLLFAFFGLLALVVIGASSRGDNYEEKRAQERAKKLQTAREQTASALTTYAWVDKTKGVARIPINEAMKLTVAELSQKSPAPANPIVEATPASPSAAPAAAPAAASPAPSPASVSETPKPASVSGPNSENRSQPAAANNPPPAPPGTQPGASAAPAASSPSAAVKAPVSPSAAPSPSAHGTPLPVRGKTP